MIIIVTGCPGTGKTTLARMLKEKLGYPRLDVKRLISTEKLYDSYDSERKCYVVSVPKLKRALIHKIKDQNLIIDSHLAHYLDPKYVDQCIVTKCSLKILQERLKKRRYSKAKIRENLDAEIFDTCAVEAAEKGHRITVIDTTKGIKRAQLNTIIG